MIIKQLTSPHDKSEVCNKILRSLPLWFGIESAIVDYVNDVKVMDTWVALENNETIGFISINKHNLFTAEIHVIGILENYHRKNLGSKLIECAETYLIKGGFKFLQVKTLSESRENESYAKTRNFYVKSGFVPVEEFKTLWGEYNPCLLMIKSLESKKTNSLLSHLEINVSDYARSIRFYDTILTPLGWQRLVCQNSFTTFSDGNLKLVISPTENKFITNGFHRKRIGLNHIAFYAPSKEFVDNFQHEVLSKNNIQCLYENKPSGDNTYYALFFEDPDRIKIEVVFSPNYCSTMHWTNKFESDFDPYTESEMLP